VSPAVECFCILQTSAGFVNTTSKSILEAEFEQKKERSQSAHFYREKLAEG